VLNPGRYIGSEEPTDDGEPVSEKIVGLTQALLLRFDESDQLQRQVRQNLGRLDVN